MPQQSDSFIEQFHSSNQARHNLRQICLLLSFAVILAVFWGLKLTGIGIAGEAFCGQPEHAHSEACYAPILVCQEGATEATETTETTETIDATEGTEATEAAHIHSESCYEMTIACGMEAHIHLESCYSDITADIETEADWDLTYMVLGPTIRENLVTVAQSQLGYQESVLNFQVDAQGIRRGITRYGQWYGNPYGDWSAMFAGFCLANAGAGDAPINGGVEAMRLEWEAEELYYPAAEQDPEIGLLLFLEMQPHDTPRADCVGIVTDFDETTVTFIAGDWENTVAQVQLEITDPAILGYGLVPVESPSLYAPDDCYIWLDGTCGKMVHLTGSPNTCYTRKKNSTFTLPAEWSSPYKYSYKLRGWFNISTNTYYAAGADMPVTGNAVLYADWVPASYDLGFDNGYVANTVSTSTFMTSHMFDYNYLFNLQSVKSNITVNANSHSETWTMVSSGKVNYTNDGKEKQTLNFIFTDNDSDGMLNFPNSRSDWNKYHSATTVTKGIYSKNLGDVLFSTDNSFDPTDGSGILGKTYLGKADHLFQIMQDPSDPHYGYYYYDSQRNAASYSKSDQRFYVYKYLAATSDSLNNDRSDFIPMNSPYANTNGKTVGTFTRDGENGQYKGVTHYRYDSRYDSGDHNTKDSVDADYAYGLRLDVQFYLPNDPGTGGNKDLLGNDMQFQFSGDDDLWVLLDGVVALDIGGIHEIVSGTIDFSTGKVVVNGSNTTSLMDLNITAGDHVMTVLYLERGSSMSNCAIYFNLAPRYGLDIQKEDVLTQELLEGTEFTVYTDAACTKPAKLWTSEKVYHDDITDGVQDQTQSTFRVENGVASIWGFGAGNTYYIKETSPPGKHGYALPYGTIHLTGKATYLVEIIDDANGHKPSPGVTLHNVRVDEDRNVLCLTMTNAPASVTEVTTVEVVKKWEDTASHSSDGVQVYLTVADPSGNVRRIREVTLSEANDWRYTWTNLPKHYYDTETEVQYGVEESYESGYYSTVRQMTKLEITTNKWAEALSFQDGQTCILRTEKGYLSTQNNDKDTGYKWVDEKTAKSSPNALWTTAVSNSTVKFTNGVGQTITLYYGNNNPTDFYARIDAPQSADRQAFNFAETDGGLVFYYLNGNDRYYLSARTKDNGKFYCDKNDSSGALVFTPICYITQTEEHDVTGWAYQITNTPLAPGNETSLTVTKAWDVPEGYGAALYQNFSVTVYLMADGQSTGRKMTLSQSNNWTGVFLGLPYKNAGGKVVQYTVMESWQNPQWSVQYGKINASNGSPPKYSTVITNIYHDMGPELPSTGSAARLMFILCGSGIMLGSLVYGIRARRKRERRTEDAF